jgi:hypothetical protein
MRAGLLAIALALAALPAAAHWVEPEQVVAQLRAEPDCGVVDVRRAARIPRLLVVEVDARWAVLPAERRRRTAETWWSLWRESTADGIVAITDGRGESLVNFDAVGGAHLR